MIVSLSEVRLYKFPDVLQIDEIKEEDELVSRRDDLVANSVRIRTVGVLRESLIDVTNKATVKSLLAHRR